MPGKIVKLPDAVANQIAAGEVVERPVAVVKELVENALDAGARSVEIQFEQGGKALIRVLDDGIGMSPEDALLALERHATSKIREVQDILEISSFGFRGEALPSIASVSHFLLRTRQHSSGEGTEIRTAGGRKPEIRSCGMPPGTEVVVSQLFHSVPARRKFMKTDRTEAAHILQMCRLLAIAHPEVAFSLIEDGREVFRTPVCPDRLQRVREIFGKRRAEDLLTIEVEHAGIKITGLIGRPNAGRSTRAEMITYVNHRPVDSRLLNYALIESYHRYLPRGRYPVAFLFVDLPAGDVDVNVHPTKREVRFRAESTVRNAVMSTITEILANESRRGLVQAEPVESIKPVPVPAISRPPVVLPEMPIRKEPFPEIVERPMVERSSTAPPAPSTIKPAEINWLYCGVFRKQVGIFETPDGLVLLNARAARERILFELIEASFHGESIPQQPLLIPTLLELPPLEGSLLAEQLEFFQSIGFEIEPFGRHLFRIRSVPAWIREETSESFVEDLVHKIRERGLRPQDRQAAQKLVARLAAARDARGFTVTGEGAWQDLVKELLACENPLLDARGRPTFVEMRHSEISRKLMLDGIAAESDGLDSGH